MPRSLILGEGGLTALWDDRGSIRELYFPGPGHSNHLQDGGIRFGLWQNGRLNWLDVIDVDRAFRLESSGAYCRYEFARPIECRAHTATDTRTLHLEWIGIPIDAKLYVSSLFHIAETDIGHTAMFVEESGDVIVFREGLGFVWTCSSLPIHGFACGIAGFDGAEGTWRDAEDGQLSGNPIAQGSVDATIELIPDEKGEIRLTLRAVSDPFVPQPYFRKREFGAESDSRQPDSYSWLNKIPIRFRPVAETSIRVLRAHLDAGRIPVAALDREVMSTNRAHYAHCWMRDAVHTVDTLVDVGQVEPAKGLLEFCSQVLDRSQPAFLQKYTVNGHLASTWHPWLANQAPIQADETAWVVRLACRMAIEGHVANEWTWNELVGPCSGFLAEFVDQDGLPKPSWDLWEERCDVSANTVCATIAALRDAANFANSIGIESRFEVIADHMHRTFCEQFFDAHSLTMKRRKSNDPVVDASMMSIILDGVIEPHDPRADALLERIHSQLFVDGSIGGCARYENDGYFRQLDQGPGNPWIICTLWYAQCLLMRTRVCVDLDEPIRWLDWCLDRASQAGLFAEQFHPETGQPLVVMPLAWSHAEFLRTLHQLSTVATRLDAKIA